MTNEFLQQLANARTEEERSWIVIESSLNSLSNDVLLAAWTATIPHWFDTKILAALNPEISSRAEEIYVELQNLSFVEIFSGRGHSVHEATRKLMLTRLWAENPDWVQQLSVNASNYFADYNIRRAEFEIECLYHQIIGNPSNFRKNISQVIQQWMRSSRTAEVGFLKNRLIEQIDIINSVIIQNNHLKKELEIQLQTISEELLKLIEEISLTGQINLDRKNPSVEWIELRNKAEKMWRRVVLLQPNNRDDFEATILWTVAQGEEEELKLIQKVTENPPFSSNRIDILLQLAQEKIKKRITAASKALSIDKDTFTRDRVVKFNAPVLEKWKQKIEQLGAKILQPLGRSEFVVAVPSEDIARQISNFEEIIHIIPYVPTIRVHPQSLQNLGQPATKEAIAAARLNAAKNANYRPKNMTLPGILIAAFFTQEDRDFAAISLESEGIRIADRPGKNNLIIDLSSDTNAVQSLKIVSSKVGLQSLEEKTIPKLFNDKARHVIAKGVIASDTMPTLGLTGKGELIAIADTGLDTGDIETIHLDFQGRVNSLKSYPIKSSLTPYVLNPGGDDDASDSYSGHGTHVAGSALGSGEQAKVFGLSSIPAGIAPEAQLVFQSIEQAPKWNIEGKLLWLNTYIKNPPKSGLFGIPDDLEQLFQDAYDSDARIHSNSWGGGEAGAYESQCEDLDRFVWEHKKFLIVFAAGQDGKQIFSLQSAIELGSITSPATAKNCLTVGASENNRSDQFSDTYGNWFPQNFPYEPFKSDSIADSIDDIAAYSSRGPCLDGRRKPDVIAPGSFVLSTRSSQIPNNNFAWGAYPPAKYHYMYMGGTSNSTALVAGCAALVRQYLREQHQSSISDPSAALVKAILIHSAQYIDYRYAHPASAPWADNEQGWGRVDLQKVLKPATTTQSILIDEANGLITGEKHEHKVKITDSSIPLKVTLVYTDYPGENLINNLNLIVHSPSGKHYLGNDFEETGNSDNINNVEGVVIKSPEIGEWRIEIVADVQMGQQDYAVVISGGGALRIS